MTGALPVAQAVADAPEAALSEGQKALAEAEASGTRVEVTGERSERTTVYGNPDGYTFTLEESAVPVRVPKPGGGWQVPDATLEVRSDGAVAPKAAAVEMEFSGGGESDPLVKISERGRSLQLGWRGKLPTPELHGASALYQEVLPGVDLKVTASVEGFRHVLVVKTPEAAASDELRQIDYSLKARDLDILEGKAGNLTAVDDDGNRVFRAPPAQMWDSAGAAAGTQTMSLTASAAGATEAGAADPAKNSDSSEEGVEPGPSDTVVRMDVDVTEDALSVVPDGNMLSKTDASAFPLYIDPNITWSESERTLLRDDGYESYGWGNGDDGLGKGVGECGVWNNYYCGPGYVQRLYFEFSPASLKGKRVLDASFKVTEPWAFQCDPRWVDLVRTKDNISSSTTWTSRPMGWDLMGDRYVSAGRGSLCDPDSPDAPIEFNDNPDESNENLTPTVRDFAAGKFARFTLMVKAHDESDTGAWKRFKNDAVLSVDFVGLPDKPTGIGVNIGNKPVCETSSSDPLIASSLEPQLMATAQTKSGGEKDAQLRVYFDLDQRTSDGAWSDAAAGTGDLSPSTGYTGDGKTVTKNWSKLTEGTLYRYRAWVRSYYNGGSYLSGPSNASTTGWCYFKPDPTRPKAPTITVGSPYSECTSSVCSAGGGPGVKGTFTFGPATGETNVAYQYKLSSEDAWSSAITGSTVTRDIVPERSGTYSLYVRAKDSLGWGAQNVVDFLVAAGEPTVGRWHFDESSGAALDSATTDGNDDASLGGDAARDDRGRRGLVTHDAEGQPLESAVTDKGLVLNGSSGYAATDGQVLETRSSYTLAAWVRVDPTANHTLTVLSQSPTASPWTQKFSPFYLSYGVDGSDYWSMRVLSTDHTYHEVKSSHSSSRGVWTHVAGVHDATNRTISLYVNGVFQGSTDAGTSWEADGPLQIGRVLHADTYKDFMHGSIDEPAVWQRALTPKEIRDEARLLISDKYAGAELVADFSAARGSGTTVADTTSGYGKTLTLAGGASLDGENIALDGVDDAAAAGGPLVDDSSSFTATTLVKLDAVKLLTKDIGYTGQVIGQRTTDGSAWGMWYELTGKDTVLDEETLEEVTVPVGIWHFGRLNADGTFSSVVSDEVAAMDTSVRLTGVHDSVDGTISLYLGYERNGDLTPYTAKVGSGDFAVGKAFVSGAWKSFLPGRIAEVRLWSGAMASSDQIEVRVGD
ncbi:LamG-like jellyroll fold domain-containing protein [Streptomyces phaeochromogenes]